MNALLSEIRRSLVELDKGLKGQLNMSQSMEDLATAFGLNEWPGRNPFAQVGVVAESTRPLREVDIDLLKGLSLVPDRVYPVSAPVRLFIHSLVEIYFEVMVYIAVRLN